MEIWIVTWVVGWILQEDCLVMDLPELLHLLAHLFERGMLWQELTGWQVGGKILLMASPAINGEHSGT